MKIIKLFTPNFEKKSRKNKDIKFIILHYTGMQSEIDSINWLKNKKSKVSCHYLINRKGKIFQLVKNNKVAWHAGKSRWKNFNNLNDHSIGIELVNKGHQFGYESFPKSQIQSLISLCKKLKKKFKIKKENFLGHSDIAPFRKKDPGQKFPWKKLSKHKLGVWFQKKKLNIIFKKDKKSRNLFFKNLFNIGYRYFNAKRSFKKKDEYIIKAFQSRYNPKKVSGVIDQKTFEISHFLQN